MSVAAITYLLESAEHGPEIEAINEEAFGPGRFARAAYKIREGGGHDRALSYVAILDGVVVASVRMTPIAAGEGRAYLLGPLAVRPAYKNLGIGRKLVAIAVEAAKTTNAGAVVLVGDGPYYGPLGFARVAYGQMTMPRPVDPERLLAYELRDGAVAELKGDVVHADVAEARAAALHRGAAAPSAKRAVA